MAAVVGALRVDLGLNSAEFESGLTKARNGLGNFAKAAGIGLAAVATAALAVGSALGVAVKGAIDNADHMDELAQSAGVSVEALTRQGYAAKFSGIEVDSLAGALGKLSQNMLAVAQGGTGPAATAFSALGISVQNASGSLRGADQVLLDVADKFSRMEDGAQKTALAVQLFGKSGAQLIPFLNEGRDGIGALTAEADRLGITLSSGTASAAGQFNDTLDRMQATFQGVINKVAAGVLPSLNELGAKLADPQFAESAQSIGAAIVEGLKLAVDAINTTVGALQVLGNTMRSIGIYNHGEGFQKFNTPDEAKQQLTQALNAGNTSGSGDFYKGIFGATAPEMVASSQTVADAFVPVIQNATAAGAATSALSETMTQAKAVFDATRTPAEAYSIEVQRLNALLQSGAINQDTYNRAVLQAQEAFDTAKSAGSQLASTLSNGLAGVFSSVVDGSKSAVEAVGDLLKSLANLAIQKGFELLIGAIFPTGIKIPGFAEGTNFAPGGLAMVGERGPELVNLPRGSQVIPNSDLGGAGSGRVRLELGPGLVAQILDQSAAQSVSIVRAYDNNLGSSVADKQRRATGGFGGF